MSLASDFGRRALLVFGLAMVAVPHAASADDEPREASQPAATRILFMAPEATRAAWLEALELELAGQPFVVVEDAATPVDALVRVEPVHASDLLVRVRSRASATDSAIDRTITLSARIDERTLAMIVVSMLLDPGLAPPPPSVEREQRSENAVSPPAAPATMPRPADAAPSTSHVAASLADPIRGSVVRARDRGLLFSIGGTGFVLTTENLSFGGFAGAVGLGYGYNDSFDILVWIEGGVANTPWSLTEQVVSFEPWFRVCPEVGARVGAAAIRFLFGTHLCAGLTAGLRAGAFGRGFQPYFSAGGYAGMAILTTGGPELTLRADMDAALLWGAMFLPSLRFFATWSFG